jgi:predicted acetyltransferase
MAPNDVSPSRNQHASHPVSPLQEGEVEAFFETDAVAFGARMSKGFRELVEKVMTIDRVVASRDGDELVGTAASETSEMTVPGLTQVRAALVVGVSVAPTHRREGRLTSLMRYQLEDVHSRGEVLAALYASEGGIYGRFGYGQATFGCTYRLDKRVARLARPVRDFARGHVRLVSRDAATEAFPAVYDAYAPTRAGEIKRDEINYAQALGEPGGDDLQRRFYAVYEEDGNIDGYVGYEVAAMEDPTSRDRHVAVHELCSLTTAAYVALWGFLLGIDLTVELRAYGRPVDEAIRWMLGDPRQLRTTRWNDRSWLRIVDVEAALGARHYGRAGAIVLRVEDAFCPWNQGCYELVVTEDGGPAEIARVDQHEADLELDASTLASVYLGGVAPTTFGAAGRIHETTPGSIRRADLMFANDRPPFSTTAF